MTSYKVNYLGIKTENNWSHFSWVITINGVDFPYKTGLGHCVVTSKKPNNQHIMIYLTGPEKRLVSKKYIDSKIAVKVPKIKDVLYALAVDYSLSNDTFEDFCANLSYDTDSRKALALYLECQESGKRLRKIVKSENAIERILAWEL